MIKGQVLSIKGNDETIMHEDLMFRQRGWIPNRSDKVYFIIRCYFKFSEIDTSYETRGSDFMQAIEHCLFPVSDKARNDLVTIELVSLFYNIWAVVGVPKGDFQSVVDLAHKMNLQVEPGVPDVFQSNPMTCRFPLKDEGNVHHTLRDLQICRTLKRAS